MKTIYVVIQGEYDYEGSTSNPIYATPDRDKALAKVTAMEALKVNVLKAGIDADESVKVWDADNPRIWPGIAKLLPIPNFPGKKKNWTKEQTAESNRVTRANYELAMTAGQPARDWTQRRYEERCRFTATLPEDVRENMLYISERTQFDIEEVPFEE